MRRRYIDLYIFVPAEYRHARFLALTVRSQHFSVHARGCVFSFLIKRPPETGPRGFPLRSCEEALSLSVLVHKEA
jgi:hypothetical protein